MISIELLGHSIIRSVSAREREREKREERSRQRREEKGREEKRREEKRREEKRREEKRREEEKRTKREIATLLFLTCLTVHTAFASGSNENYSFAFINDQLHAHTTGSTEGRTHVASRPLHKFDFTARTGNIYMDLDLVGGRDAWYLEITPVLTDLVGHVFVPGDAGVSGPVNSIRLRMNGNGFQITRIAANGSHYDVQNQIEDIDWSANYNYKVRRGRRGRKRKRRKRKRKQRKRKRRKRKRRKRKRRKRKRRKRKRKGKRKKADKKRKERKERKRKEDRRKGSLTLVS
jgi:hypothetical protein